nr:very short patch repair endonuclease [Brevibacterium sp. 'Marine']
MKANRSRDTKPEIAVRRALHRRGWRFRIEFHALQNDKRRTVDIAFTRHRLAIQIDGCFWHGCKDHFVLPKANRQYWKDKITRNQARDLETNQLLKEDGWIVLRFWEHESIESIVSIIENTLNSTSTDRHKGQPSRN